MRRISTRLVALCWLICALHHSFIVSLCIMGIPNNAVLSVSHKWRAHTVLGHPDFDHMTLNGGGTDIDVEILEVAADAPGIVVKSTFTDAALLMEFLQKPTPSQKGIRAITVRRLSEELIKILGSFFAMDYDLWTSRLAACDREYFAAPLNESGASHFSHFHLACVDFFKATDQTPERYLRNRRINHTTRLIRLLPSQPKKERDVTEQPRLFVIRRISGHLRCDDGFWTFLYLCDPFEGFADAHFVHDSPGNTLSNLQNWISECLHEDVSHSYTEKLCVDGFGLISKILRDIKSSWKLMLTALETFLEDMSDNFDDQEFIDATGFLHRSFLLSIDYFQRQLFYHERYVSYLIGPTLHRESMIAPSSFRQDFIQEGDALKVLGLRLNALRTRTTTVLEMVLSLNGIKQNRIAMEQTRIQLQDTKIALQQGESIKKLTLVNMAFLPPSFIATVFGMNTIQTQGLQIWIFVVVALILFIFTMALALFRVKRVTTIETDDERRRKASHGTMQKFGYLVLRWIRSFQISASRDQPDLPIFEEHMKVS